MKVQDIYYRCSCKLRLKVERPYYLALIRCPECKAPAFVDTVEGQRVVRPINELEMGRTNIRMLASQEEGGPAGSYLQ